MANREPPGSDPQVFFSGERYQVIEPIGIGSMATVYRAYDRRLGVDRAIKVLHPFAESDKAAVVRFLDEARTMARIDHPNVLQIYDLGREHQSYFFISELVRGGSAKARVEGVGPMHPPEAMRIVFETLQGIAAAHAHGVIHRDIRPANLLITDSQTVRLADFGLARLRARDSDFTTSGRALGDDNYAAPEQLIDARYVSAASDLHAVGATLFYLLSSKDHLDVTASGTWPSVHAAIHPVLRQSLAYEPSDRFESAREMAVAVAKAHDIVVKAYEEPPRGEFWMERFDQLLEGVKMSVQSAQGT